MGICTVSSQCQFIRQQWRMWIETSTRLRTTLAGTNSFASNGECGLKRVGRDVGKVFGQKFIRQQWRMWIETSMASCVAGVLREFIRQQWRMWIETPNRHSELRNDPNSFASNGECGLKPKLAALLVAPHLIHSPAMANVD